MSRFDSDALRVAQVWQFDRPGCPLCRIAEEAEERFFFWFLRESHYSFPVLEHLDTSTLCRRHATKVIGDDNCRLSATFEVLGRKELARLAELAEALHGEQPVAQDRWLRRGKQRSGPKGMASSLDAPAGCLACEAAATAAQGEAIVMVPVLATHDGRRCYVAGDGFCRVHLWLVLSLCPRKTAAWLTEDATRRMADLVSALELYSRHLDYRFQHEAKGEEQTAWKRALRYFWRDPPSAGH